MTFDTETMELIEAHASLIRSLNTPSDESWSLAQPSPFVAVPAIITDSVNVDTSSPHVP